MDLRSIRYFLAVLDEGSFRGAGRRMGVSQPAVSQGVALLEEELGARLFDRESRTVALTPAGQLLEEPARRVVADFDGLGARLDRGRGLVRGRLEIGTTDAASIYALPPVYRRFRRRYPEAELSVRVEGTESLLAQLARESIEIAVLHVAAGDRTIDLSDSRRVGTPLYREDLQFVVSHRHALAARRRVRLVDLAEVPFLTFKEDSITRQAIEDVFRAGRVPFRVAMEISSPEAIKKLVEVGLGASVLPARAIRPEVRSGTLVPLSVVGTKLSRVLGVVRPARRTPSPAASAFLELAESIRNVPQPS